MHEEAGDLRKQPRRPVGEREERRGQHHAVDLRSEPLRRKQRHRRAGRMREHVVRRRAVRQHHLLHDRLEVVHVVGEIAHMALARVAEEPRRAALPAQIEGRHGEAAPAQVVDGLEIFLDELGAAVQDHDGAAHRRAVRRPARIAQIDAVFRRHSIDDSAFRNRIGRDFDKTGQAAPERCIASRPLPGDSSRR